MYRLSADKISKRFGERKVFSKISFDVSTGDSLAIVGSNGSGKSTLLQIILSIFRPTRGSVTFYENNHKIDDDNLRNKISFVAPYLNLYDQLTGEENLKFFSTVAGGFITGKEIDQLLSRVGLEGRGIDFVAGYSSGMKQRLKYAVALLNKPQFLFLDEPTSNLDDDGKSIVFELIEEHRKDSVIVIATNEKEEYSLAQQLCRLDS